MFGFENIQKYIEGGTTIIRDQVVSKHKDIPLPGRIVDFKMSSCIKVLSVFTVADTAKMDGQREVCNGVPDLMGCLENDTRKIISTSPSKHSYMVSYLRKDR